MYETIKYEVKQNIGFVTIARPEALNALNSLVLHELYDVFNVIAQDDEVRCVVLTGEGRSFVAGADIKEMSGFTAIEGKRFGQFGCTVMSNIEKLEKPVIAAVNGFALGGGCELAMACDIRIASQKALFGQPEVGLGITPGFGGTQRMSKIVGPGMASMLILSANNIKADEALRIGLVEKVVEPEELMTVVTELANKIASNAPVAVAQAKTMINRGLTLSHAEGCAIESEGFGVCFGTEDQKEGMEAFLTKRKAEFKNR